MLDHVTTVRAREVGRTLTRALSRTGRTASEMAALLAWSPSKISRMLSGKRLVSSVDIAAFLALCRVVGPERDEALRVARDAYGTTWWQDFGDRLPARLVTLTDNEEIATAITAFGDAVVPDLVQTPEYARARLRAVTTLPDRDVDARVAEISRRQRILERPAAPALRVFVDEYALIRTGAGDQVMARQARHLVGVSARPAVEVRVVPERHAFRQLTPFTLLEFADLPPVAYLEMPTSVAFLEAAAAIRTYRSAVTSLAEHALDPAASAAWLTEMAQRRGGA